MKKLSSFLLSFIVFFISQVIYLTMAFITVLFGVFHLPNQWCWRAYSHITVVIAYKMLSVHKKIVWYGKEATNDAKTIVIFGPHPLDMAVPGYFEAITGQFPDASIHAVIGGHASKLVTTPGKLAGGIVIDRDTGGPGVLEKIRKDVQKILEKSGKHIFVIFPDGSRAKNHKRVIRSNRKLSELGLAPLGYVLKPSPNGLKTLRANLPKDTAFIRVWSSFNVWAPSVWSIRRLIGSTLTIQFQIQDWSRTSDKEVVNRLNDEYKDFDLWVEEVIGQRSPYL